MSSSATPRHFKHPGLLHTDEDFSRMKSKVDSQSSPWVDGWKLLLANKHASLQHVSKPHKEVYRGYDGKHPQNFGHLYDDAASAYTLALRWKISGDDSYAQASVAILNGWAVLGSIGGTSDKYLASGIYGYQMANAAEIVRAYSGWQPHDFAAFNSMMLRVFYSMNHDFLVRHNGRDVDHYWCNWDACNMASMLAIGVLTDRADIFDEAVTYFTCGAGQGSIHRAVCTIHPDEHVGQWQESGRDQAHCMLGVGLLSTTAQMAWSQGVDLFGYADNRLLRGAEYVARYNLGNDVPYTAYTYGSVVQKAISSGSRGQLKPMWELLYNHYVKVANQPAPYIEQFAAKVRPEGGGGNYGPNSDGYDHLGYGTLTFTR